MGEYKGEFSSDYQEYCCNWTSTDEFIKAAVNKLSFGVFAFPMFAVPFCNTLVQTVEPLVNKQGLEEIPVGQFNNALPLLGWITNQISQLANKLFTPDKISYCLEAHSFCVVSKSTKSVHIVPLVDNCDLVLNVTLSSSCEGGELFHYNNATDSFAKLPPLPVGTAVMHLGGLPHGSHKVVSGTSFNLIMQFKRTDRFAHLSELPPHVEKRVLGFLSPTELLSFGACSKHCHSLSVDAHLWGAFVLPVIPSDNSQKVTEERTSFEKFKLSYSLAKEKGYARSYLIWQEILTTERTYVSALQTLSEDYLKSLYDENSISGLNYSLILRILELNSALLTRIGTAIGTHDHSQLFGAFVTFCNGLSPYLQYIMHYTEFVSNCNPIAKKLRKLQTQNAIPHEMRSYLIMPVSRIPRYTLLLQELHKATPTEFQLNKCRLQYLKDQLKSICDLFNTRINNNNK